MTLLLFRRGWVAYQSIFCLNWARHFFFSLLLVVDIPFHFHTPGEPLDSC